MIEVSFFNDVRAVSVRLLVAWITLNEVTMSYKLCLN